VLVGGELTNEWLMAAYRQGIFPWPHGGGRRSQLAWYSPDPRAILELGQMHISRRLARRQRRGEFTLTRDQDFAAVIAHCAAPRKYESQTWITPPLQQAYQSLHDNGVAHSVEVWRAGALVGGLYGVALGGYFSAESMFSLVRDASKIALAGLQEHLLARGFQLLDVQVLTPHTHSLGAKAIHRADFLRRLAAALASEASFG
jgi:leucyl/phenylalanyl-tRNA--protein transferase